jgi:hypothetical protein
MPTIRPGQIVPNSGEWAIVDARGVRGAERTLIKGEVAPPTPHSGSRFKLVRPARNAAGKGR